MPTALRSSAAGPESLMRTPEEGGASIGAYEGEEVLAAGGLQSEFAASCAASACCAPWFKTSLRAGAIDAFFLFSFSWRTSHGGRISRTVLHSTALARGIGGAADAEGATEAGRGSASLERGRASEAAGVTSARGAVGARGFSPLTAVSAGSPMKLSRSTLRAKGNRVRCVRRCPRFQRYGSGSVRTESSPMDQRRSK